MKICGIYKFTNKYNRKVYIGKSKDIYARYKTHMKQLKGNYNVYFYDALRYYGENGFDFEIIMECPKENLNYWERFYIKYYCSNEHKYGYNMTPGGDGISEWSDELREKERQSQIKRFEDENERQKCKNSAINRFKKQSERDKVRNEQYTRLENPEYREFLKEIGAKGGNKRVENYNNLSVEEQLKYIEKLKLSRNNYWNSRTDKEMDELSIKWIEYWKIHVCPIKGKHRVYDDETHTKYHYE